jgi:hypothetical protein
MILKYAEPRKSKRMASLVYTSKQGSLVSDTPGFRDNHFAIIRKGFSAEHEALTHPVVTWAAEN